jgi:hypothetical protein
MNSMLRSKYEIVDMRQIQFMEAAGEDIHIWLKFSGHYRVMHFDSPADVREAMNRWEQFLTNIDSSK